MQYHINPQTSGKLFNGSEDNPFTSFAQAEKVAKAGDIFFLTGVISEPIRWTTSGTKENPISFVVKNAKDVVSCIDGKYQFPSAKNERVGAEGLKGNDSTLVLIDASYIVWSVSIKNSRGRGIQVGSEKSKITDIILRDFGINGCRTAPIDARNCKNLVIERSSIIDTSNYNTKVRDSKRYNYAGCIKTLNVDGLTIRNNIISNHYGNVVTPSRNTKNIVIEDNFVFDCWGSLIYLHFCNTAEVRGNYLFYTPGWKQSIHAGIVVNNEEEFLDEGVIPGNFKIHNNYIFGTDNGIALWGNEGADVVTSDIGIFNNYIINTSDSAILVRDGKKVRNVIITNNRLMTKGRTIEVKGGYDNLTIHTNGFINPLAIPKEISSKTDFTVETIEGTKIMLQEFITLIEKLSHVNQCHVDELNVLLNTLSDEKAKFDAQFAEIMDKIKVIIGEPASKN